MTAAGGTIGLDRAHLVRRGLVLNWITIGYNTLEAIVSIAIGLAVGSVSLFGFGLDSVVEVSASLAAKWRLHADLDDGRRERVEYISRKIIGVSFLALATYVTWDSIAELMEGRGPARSFLGVLILTASVIVMPVLARMKRRVARGLASNAL